MKSIDYCAYTSLIDGERPGVGVIFKNCLEISDIYALHPGRLLKVKMGQLNFINIYAPAGSGQKNARRTLFNETLVRNLAPMNNLPILIGDFNCVISPSDTENNYANKKCDALKDLVNVFNYSKF